MQKTSENRPFLHVERAGPENQVAGTTPEGVRQVYRWVNDLHYTDSDGRAWTFQAIACTETDSEVTEVSGPGSLR